MTGRDPIAMLDDSLVESLLTGRAGSEHPDLQQIVALVASLSGGPAPTPTAALTELLDHGFERVVVPLRRPAARPARWALRAGTGLAAAAASVLVAGTAAALPAPLQDAVADLVSMLTPFEVPRPDGPAAPTPADGPRETDGAPGSREPARPSAPEPSAPTAATATDAHQDAAGGSDHDDPTERSEHDRQGAAQDAAEESEDATEDAADEAADDGGEGARASEDAARAAEEAAAETAEEAAEPDGTGAADVGD